MRRRRPGKPFGPVRGRLRPRSGQTDAPATPGADTGGNIADESATAPEVGFKGEDRT
jgi:hypothetical protein